MRRDDYRATLIVMLGLAAANLTGFVRQAALAHQLGAGRDADVFLIAFAVPEFLFVGLPIALAPAFIPLFADRRLRAGEANAWRFGRKVGVALLAALLLFTVLAGLGAPLTIGGLAPGFDAHERDEAVRATRLMLPAISLVGLATLAGAALQVYRRFARPALATAIYNLTFVATLLALPLAWTVGRAAWGVTLGAAAALALQLPLLWRHRPADGTGEHVADVPAHASVGQMMRLAGPLAAGYAVHHLILFVDRAMATGLGVGSAAALNYAYHLALVVGQLSGLAVSTVLFPRLAEQTVEQDAAGVRAALASALRFVWTIGLPATCGLALLRTPLVRVLLERGAFDAAATANVSGPLVWYALAVLADALCQPLWRLVYARRSAWTVLAVNSLQTGVRLLGNIALTPVFGYNGLALSAAIGLSVQVGMLAWLARRWLGIYLPRGWWHDAGRVAFATIVAAVPVALLVIQQPAAPPLLLLPIGGVLGGLIYYALIWAFMRKSSRTTGVDPVKQGDL